MKQYILYEILNIKTNERYIGVTGQLLSQRWGVHLYRLRRGKAPEIFQNAFNEYGESSFLINELNRGSQEEMFLLEKKLTANAKQTGYNSVVGGNDSEERKGCAIIFREKLKKYENYRKEFFKKIGDGNRGKVVSLETKQKQSNSRKGKKWEEYKKENRAKQYSGEGNPNYGKHKLFLDVNTGLFYDTSEVLFQLGIKEYYTLNNWMRGKIHPEVKRYVRV